MLFLLREAHREPNTQEVSDLLRSGSLCPYSGPGWGPDVFHTLLGWAEGEGRGNEPTGLAPRDLCPIMAP